MARVTMGAALAAAMGFAAYALAAPANDAKIEVTWFSARPVLSGAFVRCPPGKRVVGGGVLKVGRGILRVGGSGPLDGSRAGHPNNPAQAVANTTDGDVAKRWYAGVSNSDSSSPIGAKALAVCSRRSDARIETTPFSLAGQSTGEASARCPAGRRVVGGGVVQRTYPDNRILSSAPLDASGTMKHTRDGDVARQWHVTVHNFPAHRVYFKVFALCSADSRARIEAARSWAEGGGVGHARAKCPSHKRALGGGIIESGHRGYLRVRASGPLDATGEPAKTKDGDVPKQWQAGVENRNPYRVRVKVLAICEPR